MIADVLLLRILSDDLAKFGLFHIRQPSNPRLRRNMPPDEEIFMPELSPEFYFEKFELRLSFPILTALG